MATSENRKVEFDKIHREWFFEDTQAASEVLPHRIREFRAARELSQAALAQAMKDVGVPLTVDKVCKIEKGTRAVGVDELLAFAFVLKVPLSRLMSPPDGDRPVRAGGIGLERHEVGNWMVWGDTKQAARAKRTMRLTHDIQTMYRVVEGERDLERRAEHRRMLARLVRDLAEAIAIPPRVIKRQAKALAAAQSADESPTAIS